MREAAGAPAGEDRRPGPQPGAITLSNCNGTHCQTVICAALTLRIPACFFGGNAWSEALVLATLCGDGPGDRSAPWVRAPGTPEPAGRHATRCPCTAAVRAPGDLPGSAWPTEGPHCHSTGGARAPQVRRVLRLQYEIPRLQHELVHGFGAARGTGEWASSWLPRWQRQLLSSPAR